MSVKDYVNSLMEKTDVEHVVEKFFDFVERKLNECKKCELFKTEEERRRCLFIRYLCRWVSLAGRISTEILGELQRRGMEKERVDATIVLSVLGSLFFCGENVIVRKPRDWNFIDRVIKKNCEILGR